MKNCVILILIFTIGLLVAYDAKAKDGGWQPHPNGGSFESSHLKVTGQYAADSTILVLDDTENGQRCIIATPGIACYPTK